MQAEENKEKLNEMKATRSKFLVQCMVIQTLLYRYVNYTHDNRLKYTNLLHRSRRIKKLFCPKFDIYVRKCTINEQIVVFIITTKVMKIKHIYL